MMSREKTESATDETKTAIENLQQSNKLIRSRAMILTFFLVLMMGFSLTIDQNKKELKELDKCYDHLTGILRPDSMKQKLERDSLKYFYKTSLGAYMSLEVLYDKLKKDTFRNSEPLYNAIDKIDEVYRDRKKAQKDVTISIFGCSVPILPFLMVAPIILLILYHDFTILMLYRRNLEERLAKMNADFWKVGPEAIGLSMFNFIPYKFRYLKYLYAGFQMVILFLPLVPACYFTIYGGDEVKNLGLAVVIMNVVCCLLILANFLMLIDNENLLNIREITLIFLGRKQPVKKNTRRNLFIFLPVFLFGFTLLSFNQFSNLDFRQSFICGLTAFGEVTVLCFCSWITPSITASKLKRGFTLFEGGAFFASLFWFIIGMLACFGGIHFRDFKPNDYILFSFLLGLYGVGFKSIYILYKDRNRKQLDSLNSIKVGTTS